MAITPLPAAGDTSWDADWATDIHNAAAAVLDGRLEASALAETVRDAIGAALVAGTNVTVTVDDALNTITIAATGVPTTRTITAGTGLTGGGDLSANRTLTVSYGSAAGTAVQGNDTRVVADQAAGTASIRTIGTGALQAAAGNHLHTGVYAPATITANTQTGTTYTLVLADGGKTVEMNNAASNTLTIPTNATVAFPVGTIIEVFQLGAGQTTVAAVGGVTLRAPDGAKVAKQYGSASLRKRATDEWVLAGNTTT